MHLKLKTLELAQELGYESTNPTIHSIDKWLRNTHGLYVSFEAYLNFYNELTFKIECYAVKPKLTQLENFFHYSYEEEEFFKNYDDAYEYAITVCLNKLKSLN